MLVPCWNKLTEIVFSVRPLVAFKSILEGHHKIFGCNDHPKLAGHLTLSNTAILTKLIFHACNCYGGVHV